MDGRTDGRTDDAKTISLRLRRVIKIVLQNVLINLYFVLSNLVRLNKTHTMILVCAADDFRKYWKNCRN